MDIVTFINIRSNWANRKGTVKMAVFGKHILWKWWNIIVDW